MIKAIIFDMDGLMFDTETIWLKACDIIGKSMGYDIPLEVPISCIGTNRETTKNIFESLYDFDFEEFYTKYRNKMNDIIDTEGIGIKEGLFELLDYLKEKDYKLAIASSSRKETIDKYLRISGVDKDLFAYIVSGEDFKISKPNPEIFIKTCSLLNVKPEETMVLEDSNNGIKASSSAGCISVLIPDRDVIKKETLEMADYTVKSLKDVIDILEKR